MDANKILPRVVEEVELTAGRIDAHRDYLRGHETRTRCLLVDPIIRVLGWELEDPSQVQIEFKIEAGRPDYALMQGGVPIAVIEVKKVGKSLDGTNLVGQMMKYSADVACRTVGVIILTNGREWWLFPREDGFSRTEVTVSRGENWPVAHALVAHLLRQPEGTSPSSEELETVREHPADMSRTGTLQPWIGLDNEEFDPTGLKPSRLRLYDGTEEEISSWREVITKNAIKLVDERKLVASDCPIATGDGNRTSVVNVEPRHHGGADSNEHSWKDIGGGIWCWHTNQATGILGRTRTLLRYCGEDVSAVRFQLREDGA